MTEQTATPETGGASPSAPAAPAPAAPPKYEVYPPDEAPAAPPSAPPEKPASGSGEPPESADPAEDTGAEKPDAEKHRGGFQKRISDLTAARREAEREAAYWREQAQRGQQP